MKRRRVIAPPGVSEHQMVTARELGLLLRVKLRTVEVHTDLGMPSHKLGGSRRYKIEEVMEWYKALENRRKLYMKKGIRKPFATIAKEIAEKEADNG